MDAAASLLTRAFGIDEVLLTIYGFLLGTDMNSNAIMMKLRLVSSRFNNFFISCLRRIPLQLKYVTRDDGPSREGPIVRWLKQYDIRTLFKLVVHIEEKDIPTFREVFDGLDLSNLEVLDLSISVKIPRRNRSKVRAVFPTFAQASSLMNLKIYHNNGVESTTVYDNFLSYFPVLNSLDVTLGNYDNNMSTTLAYPRKLENLVQHNLKERNWVFQSESVKTLDTSSSFLGSIISLDCPSLEKIICLSYSWGASPGMIADISADTLVKQFGITDNDFIADYLQSNTHSIDSSNFDSIDSISVVPMDYITGKNTPIKVSRDCVLVLFAFDDPPDDAW